MSSLEDGKIRETKYVSPPKIANPGPLGLCGFALTTFVLSIHNAGSPILPAPAIVIPLALFYGGFAQLLAGMWEFKTGNTFGATAFTSYGAFWLSFAFIFLIPSVLTPVAPLTKVDVEHALGVYLLGWTIFTFLLFLATFRSTGGNMALFFFLTVTFLFLTLGKFFQLDDKSGSNGLTKTGGVFGIITALIAWYNALAGLLTPESSYFTLPLFDLRRKDD